MKTRVFCFLWRKRAVLERFYQLDGLNYRFHQLQSRHLWHLFHVLCMERSIVTMGPFRGKSYAISSLLGTLVLLLFYFTSNTSVDILSTVSVTALRSPQYVSNFLPDTGPRPKKELLRNFEVFAMALWSPVLVNDSTDVAHHILFSCFLSWLTKQKILKNTPPPL